MRRCLHEFGRDLTSRAPSGVAIPPDIPARPCWFFLPSGRAGSIFPRRRSLAGRPHRQTVSLLDTNGGAGLLRSPTFACWRWGCGAAGRSLLPVWRNAPSAAVCFPWTGLNIPADGVQPLPPPAGPAAGSPVPQIPAACPCRRLSPKRLPAGAL
jgi:hypothetical protein